ncbi:hypothetical protein KO505_05695 [Psychrosphaera sp. F3M07]|uniref:hypothetical protein n=1 Tax=Psychrosphaera sp. F3M07 TaxID=2841560 RepID=UPI001C08AD7A|nr:hypothetical protein [Psychrosphaera sp. F3M07]MBU2917456.1 hypothetical protein [Psychrosphaera sp. F3M07]
MATSIVVHLGNPKSYSTSIQHCASKYELSEQLIYSGFRPNADHKSWYKSELESKLLNVGLRYQNRFHFNEMFQQYQDYVGSQLVLAEQQQLDYFVSSENIAMKGLTNELDAYEKLRRLNLLFPERKKCVLIFRNIKRAVYSMYKEYVNHGYSFNFKCFLNEVYMYREFNFLDALLPNVMLKQIAETQSDKTTIEFVFTNNVPNYTLLKKSFSFLDLEGESHRKNTSESMQVCEVISKQNAKNSIGLSMLGMSETHRLFWHELDKDNDFYWFKRRVIKQNIKVGIQSVYKSNNKNHFDEHFYNSALYEYLKANKQAMLHNLEKVDQVLVTRGDIEDVWQGI